MKKRFLNYLIVATLAACAPEKNEVKSQGSPSPAKPTSANVSDNSKDSKEFIGPPSLFPMPSRRTTYEQVRDGKVLLQDLPLEDLCALKSIHAERLKEAEENLKAASSTHPVYQPAVDELSHELALEISLDKMLEHEISVKSNKQGCER